MRMTRSQQFALRAMDAIHPLIKQPDDFKKEYLSRAKSFPALVMQSGLVQATGFLLAKSQPPDEAKQKTATPVQMLVPASQPQDSATISAAKAPIAKHDAYAAYAKSLAGVLGCSDATALHDKATGHDLVEYRQLTRDALQAATYLRRYAQIELRVAPAAPTVVTVAEAKES